MEFLKRYENGLRAVIVPMEGFRSVACGVLVKTGSVNETEEDNGISHFIEHTVFKGTAKRSAFDISDSTDRIGAQMNAFTSKEITCYYTKSTAEHLEDTLEVLSDIFFNAVFTENELEKEKGVIEEEIKMSEDTPEDVCLDLLSESTFGKEGLGRTILGSAKNVRSFNREKVLKYMDKYYTADNVVIAIAGKVSVDTAQDLIEKYFVENFVRLKRTNREVAVKSGVGNLIKYKKTEQSHIGISFPSFSILDDKIDVLSVANVALGGAMTSRLFQKLREEMGLCYSVYSYPSAYEKTGSVDIYAGVNSQKRDKAFSEILKITQEFYKTGIGKDEFLRGKEQIKSSFIMGRENPSSIMLLFGKYYLFFNTAFDEESKLKVIENLSIDQVNGVIREVFDQNKMSVCSYGPNRHKLKF